MSDWIHCNNCFLGYSLKCKFYVTTCGHIKCQKCVSKIGPVKQCLVCNSACDLAQLSNNLKPDIQSYFRPYDESNPKQIYTFQYENAISLLKKTSSKYNIAKGEIRKYYNMVEDLRKQNAKLKMMIASATRGGGFAASTPAPGVSAAPINGPPNITPIRIPSRTSFRQINDSSLKFMPWNQPRCSADTMRQQQHTQKVHGVSKPVPSFGGPQGTMLFTPGTSNRTVNTPKNPAMMSLSRLQFSSSSNNTSPQ